jgi:GNAT superfamily N-acetyltransferase
MIVRELTASEYLNCVPRLGEILIDAVESGAGVSFMTPLSSEVAEDYWRKQLPGISAGTTVQFVAEENNVIAGTVLLIRAWAPNQPHRCDVAKLLVRRDFRRKGVGTLLMQALEQKARDLNYSLVTFDAVGHGAVEKFYSGLGFTLVGHIPGYAYDTKGLHDTAIFYKRLTPP